MRLQPIAWYPHREIKRQFCHIVHGDFTPVLGKNQNPEPLRVGQKVAEFPTNQGLLRYRRVRTENRATLLESKKVANRVGAAFMM